MSTSFWSTTRTEPPVERKAESDLEPASFTLTALNFLSALTIPGLEVDGGAGGAERPDSLGSHAGSGGYAVVEYDTHTPSGQVVAVKRSRLLAEFAPGRTPERRDDSLFPRHFEQLTLELRILGHGKLRKHPNILNIRGIYMNEVNGSPDLALVLEYSPLGSLKSFLVGRADAIPLVGRLDLIRHVAQGLEALHQVSVCHGDVKTENALVFPCRDGQWLVKISDFGQSILPPTIAIQSAAFKVPCPVGTRLLAAPELRSWRDTALRDVSFTIDSAALTDVFSFGLLAWEVLKHGQRFFDLAWLHEGDDADVDTMEEFLNSLPQNELCSRALHDVELEGWNDLGARDCLREVLGSALQDDPLTRKHMAEIVLMLPCAASQDDLPLIPIQEEPLLSSDLFPFPDDYFADVESLLVLSVSSPRSPRSDSGRSRQSASSERSLVDLFDGALPGWTFKNSLYEVRELSVSAGYQRRLIDDLPTELEQRILSELKSLATSTAETAVPVHIQAHAAMTLSESYTLGFDDKYDTDQVLHWLLEAALHGLRKAGLWYHRVCLAFGKEASPRASSLDGWNLEQRLAGTPTELYLQQRAQYQNKMVADNARESLSPGYGGLFSVPDVFVFRLSLFDEAVVDELQPLHLACWLGEDKAVKDLLGRTAPDSVSSLGLNAAHYACLGGNLSTLTMLVQHNVPLSPASFHGITPLHLAIFFSLDNLPDAVDFLLNHGVSADAESFGEIKWDDHDLRLEGTATQWATLLRHVPMVRLLLPHHIDPSDIWPLIDIATCRFYWDMLEILVPRVNLADWDADVDLAQLWAVARPFAHWIAHGGDHITAIERTVQVCIKHGLFRFKNRAYRASMLQNVIASSRTLEDFYVIKAIVKSAPASYVKHHALGNPPAFESASRAARDRFSWYDTLRRIADLYTVEELQQEHPSSASILSFTLSTGSIVGVRVLLEKGIDVNGPRFRRVMPLSLLHWYPGRRLRAVDFVSLFLDFGLDVWSDGGDFLKSCICHEGRGDIVVGLSSKLDCPVSFLVDVLDFSLSKQFAKFPLRRENDNFGPHARQEQWLHFRYLVNHAPFSRHINTAYGPGNTLIHKAAAILNIDSVQLLLDAGAHADAQFLVGRRPLLPLQVACSHARFLFFSEELGMAGSEDDLGPSRKSQALDVALELLKWHVAKGDGLFRGIKRLHLAGRMAMASEFAALLEEGHDQNARGTWPGVDGEVTPRDLLWMTLEEDKEISLILELLMPEPGPEPELEPDLQHGFESEYGSEVDLDMDST